MRYLVLSTSLNPKSRSRVLARTAADRITALIEADDAVRWFDIADLELPHCDGHTCWDHDHTVRLVEAVREADGVLLTAPIYNYGASAAAKTVVELAGDAWRGKVVAIACAAGGLFSGMGALPLLTGLMLDYQCIAVPRLVCAIGSSFEDDRLTEEVVLERLDEQVADLVHLTSTLRRSVTA